MLNTSSAKIMRTFFIWWVWFQKFIIRTWSTVWKQYRLDLTACIIQHAQSALPGKREQGRIEYKSLIILYESTMSHEAHWLILIDGHTLKTSWFIVDSCWIIILYVLPKFWQETGTKEKMMMRIIREKNINKNCFYNTLVYKQL